MPPKKPTDADQASSGQQQQTARAEEENEHATLLRDQLFEAVEDSVEAACKMAEERSARLLADAKNEAAKVAKEAADRVMKEATEAVGKLIADEFDRVRKEREALEQEKAVMEKAYSFQKNKIILNVGGQRFET